MSASEYCRRVIRWLLLPIAVLAVFVPAAAQSAAVRPLFAAPTTVATATSVGGMSEQETGDVNADGFCNIGDALKIAQCDVGLISCNFACKTFICQ